MFCAPFVSLGMSYHALPAEIPVLRLGIGHTLIVAPKSLFVVFRVPAMNLIHGLIAALMLAHRSDFESAPRRTAYSNMFVTLLFTVALKSDFEGLEFLAPATRALSPSAHWIAVGTAACVVAGIGTALIVGRKVVLPWPELRLSLHEKLALGGLFATYVAIVIASVAIAHRT